MIPKLELRHRLQLSREAAGYNRKAEEFAKELGVVRQTISNYENGHTTPDKTTLIAWSSLTNVPLWWLTDGLETEPTAVGADITEWSRREPSAVVDITSKRIAAARGARRMHGLQAA